MNIVIRETEIPLETISQLYPAAIIEYADGTVTPISLEWYDSMANRDVRLRHYAICVHYKEEGKKASVFAYETREKLDEGIAELAEQLDPSME
jgi:hypothetical protein